MGLFERLKKTLGQETRATGEVSFEDSLLNALLGSAEVSKETALQIPTVSGGIDLIANIIAGTPIKLYRDNEGKAEEIRDDYRLHILNDDTGDTLNANDFWRAMIRDYYLCKGGYAYINKSRGKIKSIHYVESEKVTVQKNTDPIFKEFDIFVNGQAYNPWDFLKILRNTRDGATGLPITQENSKLIAVSYQQLLLEYSMAKRGGNKKGFLKSEHKIDAASMEVLRKAWKDLYANEKENVILLNNGVDFKECSDTSAEMQLDENKRTNAAEFAKIFHVSPDAICGKSDDINSLAKVAAIPLMKVIECALNRDFLLEREKKELYFAFDTKELLKGEMKERFDAYKVALDSNFMQIDEVRYAEDLEPLGLTWIKLGLQDVLYDPKTKQIYTPNTNQTSMIESGLPEEKKEEQDEELQNEDDNDIIEPRGQYIQDPETGRFQGSEPSGVKKKDKTSEKKKTKYSKSKQRNRGAVQLNPKTYALLCGKFGTKYPNSQKGMRYYLQDSKYFYNVTADGYGGFVCNKRIRKKK